jgi:hypothetical protein
MDTVPAAAPGVPSPACNPHAVCIPIEHEYATPRVVPISVTAAGPRPGPDAETTDGGW